MSLRELVTYADAWLASDAAQPPQLQPPAQPKLHESIHSQALYVTNARQPVYMGVYTTMPLTPIPYAGDIVVQVNSWDTDRSRWSLDEEPKIPIVSPFVDA